MDILYFDDEPYISRCLAENLKLVYQWDVTIVSEIDSLFAKITNNPYDIIILDIMTPVPKTNMHYVIFESKEIEEMDEGMNTGVVLAKKIWKIRKSVPILFLSARTPPNAIYQFEADGKKVRYLRKPELAETIDVTLKSLLNIKELK